MTDVPLRTDPVSEFTCDCGAFLREVECGECDGEGFFTEPGFLIEPGEDEECSLCEGVGCVYLCPICEMEDGFDG